MTYRCSFLRLCASLLVAVALSACQSPALDPVEIQAAAVQTFRKPDASLTRQPAQVALNVQQTQFVQTWLNARRDGWSPHNPMATLLPDWCISLLETGGQSLGLCRYAHRVVLRGQGKALEYPLSAADEAGFSQHIGWPLATALAAAHVPPPDASWLTLEMPYGGCRLVVTGNGGGRLAYGALPAWISIPPGTFSAADIVSQLREMAAPESARTGMSPPMVALVFRPAPKRWWFPAEGAAKATANAMFRRAFEHHTLPQSGQPSSEAEALILKTCSGR